MKRKKKLIITLTIIMIFSTFSVYANPQDQVIHNNDYEENLPTISRDDSFMIPLDELRGTTPSMRGDVYIGKFYDENSTDGYKEYENNGEKYLARLRHIKRTHTEPYLCNSKYLLSLYRGQSKSVSKTVSDTRSTTISATTSSSNEIEGNFFGQKATQTIKFEVTASRNWTKTYSVTKKDVFNFPQDVPSQYSYINLYSGFTHDVYEAVVDYVPFEKYDKKTKVTNITTISEPVMPNEDVYRYVVRVYLEDGRVFRYSGVLSPDQYNGGGSIKDAPQVKKVLEKFSDGYYHECARRYNYNNKGELKYEVKVPIPTIKWEPHN
ncbi:MAG: hypothetical protein N4A68_15385 [Maledivibacter sp.]|jgi:hypothetical protein|nr:hypothetical protein [Maledivibacter sp.]